MVFTPLIATDTSANTNNHYVLIIPTISVAIHGGYRCWVRAIRSIKYINVILPKGPYPPCLRIADRALLAGYPRYIDDNNYRNIKCMKRWLYNELQTGVMCLLYVSETKPCFQNRSWLIFLTNLSNSLIFVIFLFHRNTPDLSNGTFIFGKCHRNLAVASQFKYG